MTTRRFIDFPSTERDSAMSACVRAGMAIEEFEFSIEETFDRRDGGHLRRVVNIARRKQKVFRSYDASAERNWTVSFEAALLNGEFK